MNKLIDYHSHILPGVDDGSASVDESIRMLQIEASQGIGRVVATPHFYPHRDDPGRFLQRRHRAELRLRDAMAGYENMPDLDIGAEVYFFRGMSSYEELYELTILGTDRILIEMPMSKWSDSMYAELERIYRNMGLIPIIAHVDRYISPFRSQGIPERLAELPVLVQANASFFLRSSSRNMAMKLLKADKIQLLGSDCHNLDDRKPNLGAAAALIEKRLGPAAIQRVNSYG